MLMGIEKDLEISLNFDKKWWGEGDLNSRSMSVFADDGRF